MKTLIGTMAAVLLVVAACETPGPQRIAGPTGPEASREVAVTGQSADPMVIIDGVVQTADAPNARHYGALYAGVLSANAPKSVTGLKLVGPATNPRVPDALANFPVDSIKSIEILKGNVGTAKYGPGALNGVIIITTKAAAKKN